MADDDVSRAYRRHAPTKLVKHCQFQFLLCNKTVISWLLGRIVKNYAPRYRGQLNALSPSVLQPRAIVH